MLIYNSVCVSILGIITWHVHIVIGQTSPVKTTFEKPLTKKLCLGEVCVPVTSCRTALDKVIANDLVTVRSMFCGFNGPNPQVCCNQSQVIPLDNDKVHFQDDVQKPVAVEIQSTTMKPRPILASKKPPAVELNVEALEETTLTSMKPRPILTNEKPPAIELNVQAFEETTLTPMKKLPDRNTCGVSSYDDRIIGGVLTELREHPWMALIQLDNNGRKAYICGGSLITDQHVVTAAHCATPFPGSKIVQVTLGEWDLSTEIDCIKRQCSDPPLHAQVQNVILNPEYEKRKNIHDIAIIKLVNPVTFTDFIKPICLPDTDDVAAADYVLGSQYTTVGWGETEFLQSSVVKRKVDLKAVPKRMCEDVGLINNANSPYIICAGGQKGEDTCKGDSGGPLMKVVDNNKSSNWFLYGITSSGANKCGSEGVPSAYTRLVPHMPWILNAIQY